ncbi:hypothetical protein GCM10009839_44350 [Catenulispora yoronensis]|uniref:Hsp70 protein n=1 Tax=Catenulispora yoronensis TaxID=450799 RepID=A0ABN2UJ59_9ACTN
MKAVRSGNDVTIVGFDLGHGDTALSVLWPGSREPESLPVPGAGERFPTVMAVYADDPSAPLPIEERIKIGNILDGGVVEDFFIAFKSPDLTDKTMTRGTTLFVRQILWLLDRAAVLPPGTPVRWVFGVPSGWSDETRERYRRLLVDACRGEVQVVAESRAALHHARQSGEVGLGRDTGRILIIDLGSSTADYTLVTGLESDACVVDDGTAVGGSVIDKEIQRRSVAAYKERLGNAPELVDEYLMEAGRSGLLELRCRMAKEDFFGNRPPATPIDSYPLVESKVRLKVGYASETIEVPITLTPETMEDVFATPLPELGMTWREAFERDLSAIRAHLKEEAPEAIVMTGGVSRMTYARQVVVRVFPESKVVLGTEPQLAVAKGLAILRRRQDEVAKFRQECSAYLDGPEIPARIDEELPKLAAEFGRIMSAGLVADHMIPAAMKWREAELDTIADIQDEVQRTFLEHLASDTVASELRAAVSSWTEDLAKDINQEIRKICERTGVPAEVLAVAYQPTVGKPIEADSEIAQKMALDIYKHISGWMIGVVNTVAAGVAVVAVAVVVEAVVAAFAAAAATGAAVNIWDPVLAVALLMIAGAAGLSLVARSVRRRALKKVETMRIHPKARHMVSEKRLQAKIEREVRKSSPEAAIVQEVGRGFLEENTLSICASVVDDFRSHVKAAADRAEMLVRPNRDVIRLHAADPGSTPRSPGSA